MSDLPFEVTQMQPNTHEIRFEYDADQQEWWVLLTSDRHWDHPSSDHEMQKRHLERAEEIGAPVCDLGDLFDAMQGKHDYRRDKSNLEEEYSERDYFDQLVGSAYDFFKPYADNLVFVALGNHEKSVMDEAGTNILRRLCTHLTTRQNTDVAHTGMEGWVRFVFEHASGGKVRSRNLYYHHGWGGSARVSKGTIKAERRAAMLANADLVASGHVHRSWALEMEQKRLNRNGEMEDRKQLHIQLPTYKKESTDKSGFHTENGRRPRPIGAYWLRFRMHGDHIGYQAIKAE